MPYHLKDKNLIGNRNVYIKERGRAESAMVVVVGRRWYGTVRKDIIGITLIRTVLYKLMFMLL